jgi:hypothetical protein
VVAAIDRRVRAVVCQVPLISGHDNLRALVRADFIAGFRQLFDADRLARFRGEAPAMVPVVDKDPLAPSDTVFFAFWLSHVPASAFGRFWSVVRSALTGDGRVLFVDDLPEVADRETYVAGSGEIVERRLQDGTSHQLVKVVRDRQALTRQLAGLGWQATVTRSGPGWLFGEARPALRPLPRRSRGLAARTA